jgi:hypothetical protein
MPDADDVRGLALERLDFGAHNELLRLAHPLDGGLDVAANGRVLRLKVEKGHSHGRGVLAMAGSLRAPL